MKQILKILTSLMVVITLVASPVFATSVSISGDDIIYTEDSGKPFIDENNRTQVPFRQTIEAIGADVYWDNTNKIAIAEKGEIKVEIPIGKSYIFVNGEKVVNDTAALIKNNRTYLPIRIVLEAFGYEVSWDNDSKTVIAISDLEFITIHMINVGQGDSMFIDNGDYEILIDGGPVAAGETVSNYIEKYVDGPIDLVIATHSHEDHIGGLSEIYKNYDVLQTVYSGETATTKAFQNFYNGMLSEVSYKEDADMTFNFGELEVNIIELLDNDSNSNNNSVCTYITYGNFSILANGDGESKTESILANKISTPVTVFKAGHHGSKTANTNALLSVIKPEITLISAAANNSYDHPHKAALENILKYGNAYGTWKDGNIVIKTNGDDYTCSAVYKLSVSDANDNDNTTYVTPVQADYVGNLNSKIFHYENCSSFSRMNDENKIFMTRSEFVKLGYDPCQRCNP